MNGHSFAEKHHTNGQHKRCQIDGNSQHIRAYPIRFVGLKVVIEYGYVRYRCTQKCNKCKQEYQAYSNSTHSLPVHYRFLLRITVFLRNPSFFSRSARATRRSRSSRRARRRISERMRLTPRAVPRIARPVALAPDQSTAPVLRAKRPNRSRGCSVCFAPNGGSGFTGLAVVLAVWFLVAVDRRRGLFDADDAGLRLTVGADLGFIGRSSMSVLTARSSRYLS